MAEPLRAAELGLTVEYVPRSQLRPAEVNPRKMSSAQEEELPSCLRA